MNERNQDGRFRHPLHASPALIIRVAEEGQTWRQKYHHEKQGQPVAPDLLLVMRWKEQRNRDIQTVTRGRARQQQRMGQQQHQTAGSQQVADLGVNGLSRACAR